MEDITAPQLRALADFCYTGRLPRRAATREVLSLLRLAHRYQMTHLQTTAVARMKATLALEDEAMFSAYSVALELGIEDLQKSVRFFAK